MNRLPAPAGLLIDRDKPVDFQFEGARYVGYTGDCIASALAANDVRVLSRSFKYHRPRGILGMAGQDANTLVQVADEPNVRADRYPIRPGLTVNAQNVFGSLRFDCAAVLGAFSRFLPVGFYYKAFFKPRGAWRYWEPVIRRMAGLGKIRITARHQAFDKCYAFTDVAVIGGGPSGLEAALAAAAAGAQVMLIDREPVLGGALNYTRSTVDAAHSAAVRAAMLAAVNEQPSITTLSNTACTGWFADNWLALMTPERLVKLRAKTVVIATGVIEQPLVFRNNDLPGVMQSTAAQRLIRLYGVKPGEQAVIATANNDGYGVALDLADAGIDVCVADLRLAPAHGDLVDAVRSRAIAILPGYAVTEAVAGPGKRSVSAALLARIQHDGSAPGATMSLPCDLICMAPGYSPAAQLVCHSGGSLSYDSTVSAMRIETLPGNGQYAVAAGSVNGVYEQDAVRTDGHYAGELAAHKAGIVATAPPTPPVQTDGESPNYAWPIYTHKNHREFVDFDEDLQIKDITDSVSAGYASIELVKRYSTVGMGPSQGRHSAVNTLRLVTRDTGAPLHGSRITTQRPPFEPESIAQLAGRGFQPVRRTAMHHRHVELGAQMMPAGAWLRPAYYAPRERRNAAIQTEARAVRENVALIDVGTLGKLEVRGPDAAELLERVYTFGYAKQPEGRSRYVLMTDQAGAIVDDGVACRLNQQHFYVTTTTGGSDSVFRTMLRWNAEWRLNVDIANLTGAYAAVNLAGPRSRQILQRLCDDIALGADDFPYLAVREGHVAGIPARLFRVGFVGELGYEIHMPASYGEALWDELVSAGAEFSIRPFGVEAQRILRLEKGHIIVGQDTDGLTIPQEAGMAWAIAKKKPFFLGKPALDVHAERALTRQLVGFTLSATARLPQECNLTLRNGDIAGRVTSIAHSPARGSAIGLAYVAPEQTAIGSLFDIKLSDGELLQAQVTALPFYDPDNKRQEM